MGVFCNGKYTGKERIDGKTVIVTGSNSGIGKYTAGFLYLRGARVIMACRNLEKAQQAVIDIKERFDKEEGNKGELILKHLDLSSLSSVRKCAKEILEEEENIHILINNAGIMGCPKELTEDGYELQFATNHLSHFLFTLLLLPRIIKSAPARIVTVSSYLHHFENECITFLVNIDLVPDTEYAINKPRKLQSCSNKLQKIVPKYQN